MRGSASSRSGIVAWFIVARVRRDYSWAGEGIWLILSIPLIEWGVGVLLWAIASTGLFGWLHRYFHD